MLASASIIFREHEREGRKDTSSWTTTFVTNDARSPRQAALAWYKQALVATELWNLGLVNRRHDGSQAAAYGIDAPGFLVFAAVVVLFNVLVAIWCRSFAPLPAAGAVTFFAACHVHTSLRGKFLAWGEVVAGLRLRGDERILDLGCGRGAVLLAIAKQLSSGRAIGVDIWNRSDQSGNAAAATRRNAHAEGVADRIELLTANMTALPFLSGSFDLITSNIALHNIRSQADRQKAIDEAVRVLRPGGRLVVADLRSTRRYVTRLCALGMADVARRNLGWRMWWTGPWAPTHLVTAAKRTVNETKAA